MSDPRARAVYMRLETAWRHADVHLQRLRPLDGMVDEDLLARSPFTPVPIDEYPASEETRAAAPAVIPDTTAEPRAARAGGCWGSQLRATLSGRWGLGALLWYTSQKSDWHYLCHRVRRAVENCSRRRQRHQSQHQQRAARSPRRQTFAASCLIARRSAIQGGARRQSSFLRAGEWHDGSRGRH